MKIDSIVFDFDGTLAELHLDFSDMKLRLSALAGSYSLAVPPDPFLPVLEWLVWLEKDLGRLNGAHAREFRERAMTLICEIEMEAARKGALFAFTRPLLGKMLKKGIKTAVITRNCEAAVRVVFPDIADYCDAFFARDHVPSPKPDPAHLVRALEAMGADFGTALMVGDHPIDIQTGKAAGTRTAGVFSGSASREELLRSGADWVAQNCEELVAALSEEGVLG
ncbi:MAG: HAD family hydrolase [Syntrophobacteraceae bacterium]